MKHSTSSSTGISSAGQESPVADTGGNFRGIFKASAFIGSSALINVCLQALRGKILAVLLGPAGIGLMGSFSMILDLAVSIAQLGLTQSGVRQIAEAASSGNERRLALTALVLRRTILLSAFLGAIALWVSSGAVSMLTFGTKEHATSISLLSVALFLIVVANGNGALLQGMRRTKEVAKISMYGALLYTIAAVSIIYFAAERGIVPSLVAFAIVSIVLSLLFSRNVRTVEVVLKVGEATQESALLFKLGLAFLASGILMSGATFVVRAFVIRMLGLDAAGIYQAAWILGGLYVGFVMQALAMDFYPRLVGVANDHHACNIMINQQTYFSILMAAPGIIATITFAPLVVYLFYSAKFGGAVVLLRWICLGMALRVISHPAGYIVLAKNRQLAFLAAEAAWAAFNIAATWWGLHAIGLEGAAIAFLLTNMFHALILYHQARSMTGFRMSGENLRAGFYFMLVCSIAFVSQLVLPRWPSLAFGTCLTLASLWYSIRMMVKVTEAEGSLLGISRILRLGRKK